MTQISLICKEKRFCRRICSSCAKEFWISRKDLYNKEKSRCNQCRQQQPLFIGDMSEFENKAIPGWKVQR
jgi:hypothetical protein